MGKKKPGEKPRKSPTPKASAKTEAAIERLRKAWDLGQEFTASEPSERGYYLKVAREKAEELGFSQDWVRKRMALAWGIDEDELFEIIQRMRICDSPTGVSLVTRIAGIDDPRLRENAKSAAIEGKLSQKQFEKHLQKKLKTKHSGGRPYRKRNRQENVIELRKAAIRCLQICAELQPKQIQSVGLDEFNPDVNPKAVNDTKIILFSQACQRFLDKY